MKDTKMTGQRLRLLRQARGLSLDNLAARMGGIVSKQAISKYERGLSQPSPKVLNRLAQALGVKSSSLWSEPTISVDFIAYRRGSGLSESQQDKVTSLVAETLENWVNLQDLLGDNSGARIPVQSERVKEEEDAEGVAERIRQEWGLGVAPIANVTTMLEEHSVFVVEVDAKEGFDGISAVARDGSKKVKAAAVISRRGVPGERQRLNLLHELGHLILKTSAEMDEESAAFRFGKAFLAPREVLHKEIGRKRSVLSLEELILLKKRFGLSLQALVYRLRELDIITESYYSQWFTDINQRGWKKHEPEELAPERPQWLQKSVWRALAEGIISQEKGEQLLGHRLNLSIDASWMKRRAFMQLPVPERRRILAKHAHEAVTNYEADDDWLGIVDEEGTPDL